ncbi:acetoacetate decarboxylase family protein [Duganella vulcania]|uniref:Acetoacetate decarboxylase n=1 Tax=Duganella vulcania TaxID=2692166 RepID=A0A845GV28_9BURK|nr:acetoacetate decarboxylase family protein [Duganella vulcania]MYM97066.1 hypothetical protein [Duganella vulcania]
MTSFDADPFFQYPRNAVATSAGEVAMPILYYDASQLMAFYWIDCGRAQALLGEPYDVVRFGGKALAVVAFYAYRHTSIGRYNEVGTAIACVPRGTEPPAWPLLSLFKNLDRNRLGFHVVDLPVTTPAACAAGRDIWGYPKFVTPIDFALQGASFSGAVHDPAGGAPIFSLSGTAGLGLPAPLINLILYSTHQRGMLRALINIRGKGRLCLPGSLRLRIGPGSHPMAERLTALGLQDARPAFVLHTHGLQLRLNSGAVLP